LQVLYFFCRDGGDDTSSASAAAIASNLIDQLIERNPLQSLFRILKDECTKHAKSEKCTSFEVLWNIFISMAKAFPTPIVVIVDALDECLITRKAILEGLLSFNNSKVRCFLTSRNKPAIYSTLGQVPEVAK
jgi:hypothetical protein